MSFDAHQYPLALSSPSADSVICDKIESLTAQLHDELDPFKRAEISAEVERLRRLVVRPGGPS